MFDLNRFAGASEAAQAMARAVAQDLAVALTTRERALLLVSGGRSPLVFFSALREQPVDWRRIDVSLADERCVPPAHADANAQLVKTNLLIGAARDAGWIGLMPETPTASANAAPDSSHQQWQQAMQAVEQANANLQLQRPAVIVLGIGNDGHTASLFPDAPQWPQARLARDRYVALQPQQAPHARVSLSLQALRTQGRCFLWAVGADKLATLERLQATCEQARSRSDGGDLLARAGPVACLIADPDVWLDVYCSEVA